MTPAREAPLRVGYACVALGVPSSGMKGCRMRNATPERLLSLIAHNLDALDRVIDYNIANGIRLFRISSDLVPFGSSPVNPLPWHETFAGRLQGIGRKVRDSGMRVSMHPGQYTALGSPDPDTAARAADDLAYHARVLDGLGLDATHRIVLHAGGACGDRKAAADRFAANFGRLADPARRRVALENDDRSFRITDILELAVRLGAPAVYDALHDSVNPPDDPMPAVHWIDACRGTWRPADGNPKIHYSQQDPLRRAGSHSAAIDIPGFLEFVRRLEGRTPDIMLEVKDKDLSCVRCIAACRQAGFIK